METIKGDFKKLMQRFVYGKKGTYVDGDYRISEGGYDCWFEVYIKDKFAISCVAGRIDGVVEYVGKERYEKMVKIIQEFYPQAYDFYG